MKRSYLRALGQSGSAKQKRRIQALLREIVILRDKWCVLWPYVGICGGPLQAEHLITRANSATFGDTRNIVCLCQYHHIKWKPQHSRIYWSYIEQILGPKRWEWLKLAEADKSPHKVDLTLTEIVLQKELYELQINHGTEIRYT